MIALRQATEADAARIAPFLRAPDRREVIRMGEGAVRGVLLRAIRSSDHAGVYEAEGVPLAIFGVVPGGFLNPDCGTPWMVGTDALARHRKAFLRETRAWVEEWMRHYSALSNAVDSEYDEALRWLAWLGFRIGDPQPGGLNGVAFRRVERRASWA